LLEGGSDTTLYAFVQAMMVWPEVQKKAQEEIDRVVGPNRLPEVDDYPNLPYIRCCVKETLRWMPTVILGVPHSVIQDDTYNGWVIPKGATIINNVWYVKPLHFIPIRKVLLGLGLFD
jgi:cytochrome P450